jgi:[ribosomal protein S5]-alanine N-acetyltransferase
MQFDALPESDLPGVVLRPIEEADLPVWLAYLGRPEVFEHTSWNNPRLEDLAAYLWSPAARSPAALLRLAIAERSTNALVGTIGFHTVSPVNRSAELAYDLAPTHWGRGIATRLCRRVVAWAHEQADVLRVQATVLETNARSARVLERVGFEHEGLLRSYRLVRGVPGNFHMYSHVSAPREA